MSLSFFQHPASAQTLPLFPDGIPDSKPVPDSESVNKEPGGLVTISKISRPTLTVYLPPKSIATGTAVVICPGGGYWVNAIEHEGAAVAHAFNSWGIAAFVLKYRIPSDEAMKKKEIAPLQDAEQAIKTVRDRAAEWGIDPHRIGIMGFSAGGHVASTEATHYKTVVIPNASNTDLRPDFQILIYPVISFQDSIGHIGSRDQLIGKNPSPARKNLYSNELQVTRETPAAFLVHAADDDAVNPENSIRYFQALRHAGVPAELHLYQKGGHGFGIFDKASNADWMAALRNWFFVNGWMPGTAR